MGSPAWLFLTVWLLLSVLVLLAHYKVYLMLITRDAYTNSACQIIDLGVVTLLSDGETLGRDSLAVKV